MDQILTNFIKDFTDNFEIESESDSKTFEHFVNHCILANIDNTAEAIEKVNVGGTNNPGIDGLAIVVNDHLVTTKEEVDYFHDIMKRLDVEFYFIQSKSSPKFEMSQINNFLFSVKNFFSDADLKFEDDVLNLKELKNYIYERSIDMEESPKLKLYYASTGQWLGDDNLTTLINKSKQEIFDTGLFKEVNFTPIDLNKLKSLYRESKHKITREINFEKHTILPNIDGVIESYIGFIPAQEIVRLVSNADDDIIKSVFYDNVRDFQGFNPVNSSIKRSIEERDKNDKFVLLNNGITIVAKSANKVGTNFKISDFQIVNGCQTSHVLYYLRENISESIYLPLKLIISDDNEVVTSVIKATNQQTEVKKEAFETLTPFHKTLEEYYLSFEKEDSKRLYYERRSKQFENSTINKTSIISLATQISSFVGMFLNEPHSTKRYFGELLRAYRSRLFQDNHKPIIYYTSGLALHVVEVQFKTGNLDYKNRKFKHHLMMMLRIKLAGEKIPSLSGNKIDGYCKKILNILWDRNKAKIVFKEIENELVDKIKKTQHMKRKLHMLRAFTEEIQPSIKKSKTEGALTYFNEEKGFGFIRILRTTDDVFVHITSMMEDIGKKVEVNDKIRFHVVDTYKGRQAQNLELVR